MQAYNALADCDHLIHAGDIGGPDILRELRTIAPVTAVLGNNDFPEYGDDVGRTASVTLDGVRFLVAHYPHAVDLSTWGAGQSALHAGEPIPHVCVHGHTHVPKLEWGAAARPASYLLCPGALSRPRGGNPCSIAKIKIDAGKVVAIHIQDLDGRIIAQTGAPQ